MKLDSLVNIFLYVLFPVGILVITYASFFLLPDEKEEEI